MPSNKQNGAIPKAEVTDPETGREAKLNCLILEPRGMRYGNSKWAGSARGSQSLGSSVAMPADLDNVSSLDKFTEDRRLEEISGLANAINLSIEKTLICRVQTIRPATYFSQGHLQEAQDLIEQTHIDVVIANTTLTPAQQRNLERKLHTKVLDRTGLILEIFGERARTREGRLQVDLAHLTYQKSRLVRSWTHLERQRGGAGFLGGPGETQIEADRRALSVKINRLERALERVKRTRSLHRRARTKAPNTMIALIGYTNAGKSTLFNTLTHSAILAQDQLFATLDPTMRSLDLKGGAKAILSDTVGFISDLPTELIAAFRATLEEVTQAHILLHVHDLSDPEYKAQALAVNQVLGELGLEGSDLPPVIDVYNKIDLLSEQHPNCDEYRALRERAQNNKENTQTATVFVSALTGEGLDELIATIERIEQRRNTILDIDIEPNEGRALAWLHQHAEVLSSSTSDEGRIHLSVSLNPQNLGRFEKQFGDIVSSTQH